MTFVVSSDHFARPPGIIGEAADQSAGRSALCTARLFHAGNVLSFLFLQTAIFIIIFLVPHLGLALLFIIFGC